MNKGLRLSLEPRFVELIEEGLSGQRAYAQIKEGLGYEVAYATQTRAKKRVQDRRDGKAVVGAEMPPPPSTQGASIEHLVGGRAKLDSGRVPAPTINHITTLEQLAKVCDTDLSQWKIERKKINKWDALDPRSPNGFRQMIQITGTLVPLPLSQRFDLMKSALIEMIERGAPKHRPVRRAQIDDRHCLEISMADLHVGKYAWAPESGEDYDCERASERFHDALDHIIHYSKPFGIDRILFVVGNDLTQSDNESDQTTKGTNVDTDTRYKRVFPIACELQVSAINRLREMAPVDVIIVPGNHDQLTAFHVGTFLEAWYRNDSEVTIDNTPPLRKYYRYGKTILGLTHGNEESHNNLPQILADEAPGDWAETTCREFHLGHYHKRKQTRYIAGDTHGGVMVRILPSMSATDRWHHVKGFVGGPKACEANLYHYERGYAGQLSYNVPRETG